jgi:restriction endonuclease Mrr
VVVRRDGREIGRERVTELRGALHHYGSATAGLIITTGQVLSGAREEAAATGAAPISVIDGIGLARLCEEHGVAVAGRQVRLALPDWDLLDGLRASAG